MRIIGVIFGALIVGFFLANLIKGNSSFSVLEDRDLSQRPAFTWSGLADGSYAEEFEAFESDQFAGRNFFREISTGIRRIGGRREQDSVLLGKRHQLFEDIIVPDEKLLSADIDALNSYSAEHPDVDTHILLVPDAAQILSSDLPARTEVADQEELFTAFEEKLDDDIIWMDGIEAMRRHADDKLYYLTDSLWTTQGAYDVFLETASGLGIDDPYEASYSFMCASCDYTGSLARRSGYSLGRNEELDVCLPVDNTSYLVTYTDKNETVPSLYDAEALDTADQYNVFLGGEQGVISIETAADNDRVLLVVKDSFANCYIPFLIPYFSRIIVADPEYCEGGIDTMTNAYNVTDTLFLYGGNSFFTDTALQDFIR